MPKLLTADEVAVILRVKEFRVYEMARRGVLPVVRLGRQLRFHEAKLMDWIEQGGQALPNGWHL